MKAKRYIYLLFALFIGAASLLLSLYAHFSLLSASIFSLLFLVISFYFIVFLGYLNFKYSHWIDKYLSWGRYSVPRLTFTFSLIIVVSFFSTVLLVIALDVLWGLSVAYFKLAFWSLMLGVIMTLSFIYTIEEAFRFMWRVSQLSLQVEKRKNEQTTSKLEALKKQINPHFLFNCFNVLAELVHIDSEKSDEFITEMGKIYRYILDQKKDFVVTLGQELEFIQSFIFLQQIRFDKNLIFKMNIGETSLEYFIPPLTLELLVENAIKHNQITVNSPLIIELIAEGRVLMVKNNYQPRQTDIPSTQIGLKNLKEQYQLISGQTPEFFIENGSYIAKIPLLNP